MHVPMQVKNITFVSIFFIYSHYETGKPFLTGATFFCPPPVAIAQLIHICFYNCSDTGTAYRPRLS